MTKHSPKNVITNNDWYLLAQYATCENCGASISRHEYEDDDTANGWTSWAVNEDWGSPACVVKGTK